MAIHVRATRGWNERYLDIHFGWKTSMVVLLRHCCMWCKSDVASIRYRTTGSWLTLRYQKNKVAPARVAVQLRLQSSAVTHLPSKTFLVSEMLCGA
jgi:hypothetical protein